VASCDHIKVDLTALQDLAASLQVLTREFREAPHTVSDGAQDVGAHELVDALHDFATNWDVHRKKLTSAMEHVAKLAQQGHDAFLKTDSDLARACQVSTVSASHP
jgi:hypothetical protein